MKFGKKHFLSRVHDNTDYIAWCGSSNYKQLCIHMHNVTIRLHDGGGENAVRLFVDKLERLRNAIEELIAHPIGVHRNERVWLNSEDGSIQHYTGYLAWGYSDDTFYYTIADCHRAIRGQYGHTELYGTRLIKDQFKILKRISQHLASAIIDVKKYGEKHV